MSMDNLQGKWVDAHKLFEAETRSIIDRDSEIANRRIRQLALNSQPGVDLDSAYGKTVLEEAEASYIADINHPVSQGIRRHSSGYGTFMRSEITYRGPNRFSDTSK